MSLFCPTTSDSLKPPTLPKLSGPYSVGTSIFHLVDRTRKDPVEPRSGRPRELMIQLWYPAKASQQTTAPYLADSALIGAMKQDAYLDLSSDVLERWRGLLSHSILNGKIIESPQKIPLILFSHGFGVSRSNYTLILEDLASNGFMVAAIDHPASGLTIIPDGRVVSLVPDSLGPDGKADAMVKDASFVLDMLLNGKQEAGKFSSRIDTRKIGMFGHSLGGAAALDMGRVDPRFHACLNMDGYPFGKIPIEGLHQPSLMMLQQPGLPITISDRMRFERDSLWSAIISKKKTDVYIIKIKGMSHFNFSDLPFIVPDSLLRRNGGSILPKRGHEIMTNILRAFFSFYLGDRKSESLEGVAKKYPEVTFERFNNETPMHSP